MTDDTLVYTTILAMGLVTYLTRMGGFFIASRIRSVPPELERFLGFIPGTIIVAIIAPQIADGGWLTLTASAVCLACALLFKNMVAVMVTGVVYVSLFRLLLIP